MYRLNCAGWLGNYSDIKHIVVSRNTDESRVVSQAKKISEDANGGGGLRYTTFTKVSYDD